MKKCTELIHDIKASLSDFVVVKYYYAKNIKEI